MYFCYKFHSKIPLLYLQAWRNTLLFSKPLLNHLPNHSYPPLYYPSWISLPKSLTICSTNCHPLFQLKQIPLSHSPRFSRPGHITQTAATLRQNYISRDTKTGTRTQLSGEIIKIGEKELISFHPE